MASSLPSFVNNHAEDIHKVNCGCERDAKKAKLAELNTNIATAFLNTHTNDFLECKCLCCNKNYIKKLKRFLNTYKFSNHDVNKLILML